MTLYPHDPNVRSTIQGPCQWRGKATPTPVFDGFIHTLTNGDTVLIDKCVRDNAVTEQDQEEYNKRYSALTDRYEALRAKQAALEKERRKREMKSDVLSGFLFELGELDKLDMEFKPQRWNAIVDHVTVYHDGRLVFSFHNGSEIAVTI